ncbi:ribonuclease kappa [Nilaparvata lugens]|uniref:ribonuclease kappa n=1 Tax=Nilaparvata lugens TaxID=108931 RepID=UPI000B97CC06|nr:ribonuclease kappa [Nilaparvata lugens]
MAICGPKLSLCGVIISIWGMIQLVIMGVFYSMHAVALAEDLPIEETDEFETSKDFYSAAEKGFQLNAMNCWIAACLYLFTFLFSSYQFYLNGRTSI